MLEFLIDNIFVMFDGQNKIRRQIQVNYLNSLKHN